MPWLIPSLVSTLTGSVILLGVFIYLYSLERSRFLGLWTVGWGFYACRFAFMLVFLSLNQTASLLSGVFLLLGAYEFDGRPPLARKVWLPPAAILAAWTLFSPLTDMGFFLVSLPTFVALGGVFMLTGAVILRTVKFNCPERNIAAACFFLWGLHKLDYPFLQPVLWFAPWGYILGAAFSFIAALAMILLYFRMNRLALAESEARFRIMLDNAQDALFLADQETARILDVNHLACSSLGYERPELLELSVPDVDPMVDVAGWRASWGGRPLGFSASFPSEHRRKDGSTFPVEINASIIEMHGVPMILGLSRDVSERREAEAALMESERVHRIIFENSPLGMIHFDREGNITRCNDRFVELMGSSREKLIGYNTSRQNPNPAMREAAKKALAGEESLFEDEYVSATGGRRVYLRVRFSPVDPGVNPTEVIATLEDVGEAKRADEAFQMYADIVRNMPSGLFIYQYEAPDKLYLIESNPVAEASTGISATDSNGEFNDIWSGLNFEEIKSLFLKTVRTGEGVSGEYLFYEGERFNGAFFIRSFALPADRLGVAFEDITAKKVTETALGESEAKYRQLFNEAIDPIVLADPESGLMMDCNRAAEIYFGRPREEMIGRPHYILHPGLPDDQGRAEPFRRHLEAPDLTLEAPVLAANGEERIASIKASKVVFGGKEYLMGMFRDVTENRRYEQSLCAAKEQAETASKAKNEFLATMSHEIRTPLNGVMGMLQLLQSTPLTAEQAEYVEISFSSSKNLLRLLSDILDISKIEAGLLEFSLETFTLKDVIDPVRNALTNQAAAKGLTLSFNLDPALGGRLVGDPLRIRQILFNLLGNAVKYTEKGEVSLTAARLPRGTRGSSFLVLFTVEDTGIGIPDEKIDKVFESFTQADGSYTRKYGGAGLGLAIVRRLVQMMGGNISVESEAGKGAVIHATLRLTDAEAESGASHPGARLEPITRSRGKALVVEDERINRFAIMNILKKRGIEADEAQDGAEALKAMERGRYSCVLMDVQMPVMDGVEAAKKIRAMPHPACATPIIALTAHAMPGDKERFLSAGMDGYLAKPVVTDQLFEILERFLAVPSDR